MTNAAPNTSSTPPGARTPLGQQLTDAAARQEHTLVLQTCEQCHSVQYPPREVCGDCLSDKLTWAPVDNRGTVASRVELQHSLGDFFQQRLPWVIGSIKLDCGPVIMAHMTFNLSDHEQRVKVFAHADSSGAAVLVAVSETAEVATEQQRREHMQALQLLSD